MLSYLNTSQQGTWLQGSKILATIAKDGTLISSIDKTKFSLDKNFNLIILKVADDNNGLLNFTCKTASGEHVKYHVIIKGTVHVQEQDCVGKSMSILAHKILLC